MRKIEREKSAFSTSHAALWLWISISPAWLSNRSMENCFCSLFHPMLRQYFIYIYIFPFFLPLFLPWMEKHYEFGENFIQNICETTSHRNSTGFIMCKILCLIQKYAAVQWSQKHILILLFNILLIGKREAY